MIEIVEHRSDIVAFLAPNDGSSNRREFERFSMTQRKACGDIGRDVEVMYLPPDKRNTMLLRTP